MLAIRCSPWVPPLPYIPLQNLEKKEAGKILPRKILHPKELDIKILNPKDLRPQIRFQEATRPPWPLANTRIMPLTMWSTISRPLPTADPWPLTPAFRSLRGIETLTLKPPVYGFVRRCQ